MAIKPKDEYSSDAATRTITNLMIYWERRKNNKYIRNEKRTLAHFYAMWHAEVDRLANAIANAFKIPLCESYGGGTGTFGVCVQGRDGKLDYLIRIWWE